MDPLKNYILLYKVLISYNRLCRDSPELCDEKAQAIFYVKVLSARSSYIQACKEVSSSYSFPMPLQDDVEMQRIYKTKDN